MANAFKNATIAVTTSSQDFYTTPASTEAIVHALYISNIDGTNDATIDVLIYDASKATSFHVAKTALVPADDTLILDKPINLEEGDKIQILGSADNDLEAFASILEITA